MNVQSIVQKAKDYIASHPDFENAAHELEQVAFGLVDEAVRSAVSAELGDGVGKMAADLALDGIEKVIESKFGLSAPTEIPFVGFDKPTVAAAAPTKPAPAPAKPATLTMAAQRFLRR